MIALSEKDQKQLQELGISDETLENQLDSFRNGIAPVTLVAPATIGNGLKKMTVAEIEEYGDLFQKSLAKVDIKRFVPASGAASRMFKAFHQFLDDGHENKEIETFKNGFKSFAFYDKIKCSSEPEFSCAIHNMIKTINLSELPKALIPFHAYTDGSRTAFEEHLVESAMVLDGKTNIDIHFTISAAHEVKFKQLIEEKLANLEAKHNCKFNISFSQQLHSTDTVAVNDDNSLFRNDDGAMLFRPGGHGSLLVNLNNLDAELVFIKNIDNVQIDHLKDKTVEYKKVLGGYLLDLHAKVQQALEKLESATALDDIIHLATEELMIKLPDDFASYPEEEKRRMLSSLLNRPMRICGMVKNEGEPGGGPFWTRNKQGEVSLQIVESSQVDLENAAQKEVFSGSTHFNPVDLVCWLKDKDGNSFDLAKYTDPNTAFISEKSQQGKTFKVLEHPGLWNGSMAHWTTIFVEVPIESFSPVKTINDLLRPQHQPA
jgi:hypothetical protein